MENKEGPGDFSNILNLLGKLEFSVRPPECLRKSAELEQLCNEPLTPWRDSVLCEITQCDLQTQAEMRREWSRWHSAQVTLPGSASPTGTNSACLPLQGG